MSERKMLSNEIKTMVKEKLNLRVEAHEIENDMLFGKSYGFDSTTLLEFILQLEEHYDVIVPDEDLSIENFGTIDSIVDYISVLRRE